MNYTADQVQAKLKELGACEPACEWAQGKTAAQCWDECPNVNWLMWLRHKGVWAWGEGHESEYQARRKPIDDAYLARIKPIDAAYLLQRKSIDGTCGAYLVQRKPIDDAYLARIKPIDAAYLLQCKPIDDVCVQQLANLLRSIVPNPFEKGKVSA
jgi:hypothetical protein